MNGFQPTNPRTHKKYGPCALCGKVAKLTLTHIPPHAAFNDGPKLLAGERNATWIGVTPTGTLDRAGAAGTAAAAGAQLDEALTLFRGHVDAVDAATLADPIGPIGRQFAENTRVAFVFHELDELIHHGAEVGVLRDLYRATHVA